MASIVKVDQIQNADGTVEYMNAGTIKNASLHSSVTGGSGITALGTVASGTLNSSVNINSALSSATFPAGQILHTQYDSYSTQTTIGDTNTYILTCTFNTKGTNSRILVLTNLLYGASGDNLGFHGGITMTTGSSASTDYINDAIQLGEGEGVGTGSNQGRLFADDIGNGRLNGYGIQVWYANASKVTSFSKDTQITVGLWLNGDTTMYINRAESRGNYNEMNLSTMTVFEIAV